MKVLQINSVCGVKSTGRICTDIAEVLKQNGHDCKIAYGREKAPEKYKDIAVRIGSDLGVKMHAFSSRIFDNSGFGSKCATGKFIKWVEEYDPDIIHLHNIHGYYINIEILFDYIKKANKPVVWTFHDCWAFTGHCAYFDSANCEKWKVGCQNCPLSKSYPKSIFWDNSKKNYENKKKLFSEIEQMSIVTPSQWLAEFVKKSFLSKYKVEVINNGIDINIFKPTQSDFREKFDLVNKKIILGVATPWSKRKGLLDFIELSKRIKDDYKIVLVGLTDKQKEALPDSIIGITRTNNAVELAEIYSAADVFVNPTYSDNYPTVNLEAQACGTPVITYRTGGSIESVPPDQVVDKGDLCSLQSKIYEICENEKSEVPDRSRFDKTALFEQYLQLYKDLKRD